jgi:hypothetical protein
VRTDGAYSLIGWRPGDTYPGGFSAAEARALRDFQIAHDFKTALSLHSRNEVVEYPWGYTGDPAPDFDDLVAMANLMANWTGYFPQQMYTLIKQSGLWDDWSYGARGTYTFTIGMGNNFHVATTEILNQSKLILSSELFLLKTADDLHLKEPVVNLTNAPLAVVEPNTDATITARVEAPNGLAEAGTVSLVYSRNGGIGWTQIPMTAADNASTFTAAIPGLRPGSAALYFVKVTDDHGITRTGPFSAPYVAFEVRARDGILEQVGQFGLVAILAGAGAAGVLYCLRVWGPAHRMGSRTAANQGLSAASAVSPQPSGLAPSRPRLLRRR